MTPHPARLGLLLTPLLLPLLSGCANVEPPPNGGVAGFQAIVGSNGFEFDLTTDLLTQGGFWAFVEPSSPSQSIELTGFVGMGPGYGGLMESCGVVQVGPRRAWFTFNGEQMSVEGSIVPQPTVPVVRGSLGLTFTLPIPNNGSGPLPVFIVIEGATTDAGSHSIKDFILRSDDPFRVQSLA